MTSWEDQPDACSPPSRTQKEAIDWVRQNSHSQRVPSSDTSTRKFLTIGAPRCLRGTGFLSGRFAL
jgi:hypothetical protein